MSNQLCDLKYHKQYFCDMQRLLIKSEKMDDATYIKHYIRSFPEALLDAVEQYIKDKGLSASGMSISQYNQHVLQCI